MTAGHTKITIVDHTQKTTMGLRMRRYTLALTAKTSFHHRPCADLLPHRCAQGHAREQQHHASSSTSLTLLMSLHLHTLKLHCPSTRLSQSCHTSYPIPQEWYLRRAALPLRFVQSPSPQLCLLPCPFSPPDHYGVSLQATPMRACWHARRQLPAIVLMRPPSTPPATHRAHQQRRLHALRQSYEANAVPLSPAHNLSTRWGVHRLQWAQSLSPHCTRPRHEARPRPPVTSPSPSLDMLASSQVALPLSISAPVVCLPARQALAARNSPFLSLPSGEPQRALHLQRGCLYPHKALSSPSGKAQQPASAVRQGPVTPKGSSKATQQRTRASPLPPLLPPHHAPRRYAGSHSRTAAALEHQGSPPAARGPSFLHRPSFSRLRGGQAPAPRWPMVVTGGARGHGTQFPERCRYEGGGQARSTCSVCLLTQACLPVLLAAGPCMRRRRCCSRSALSQMLVLGMPQTCPFAPILRPLSCLPHPNAPAGMRKRKHAAPAALSGGARAAAAPARQMRLCRVCRSMHTTNPLDWGCPGCRRIPVSIAGPPDCKPPAPSPHSSCTSYTDAHRRACAQHTQQRLRAHVCAPCASCEPNQILHRRIGWPLTCTYSSILLTMGAFAYLRTAGPLAVVNERPMLKSSTGRCMTASEPMRPPPTSSCAHACMCMCMRVLRVCVCLFVVPVRACVHASVFTHALGHNSRLPPQCADTHA